MNFREIYERYKNDVYNVALQYVQNREDAEEITQDVFLKIYEKAQLFRQESNIKTWIYRITINSSLDFIKAIQRQKRSFLSNIFRTEINDKVLSIPDFNHPGIKLEQKEAMKNIFHALNQLPENQKTAIILLKIEGLSQEEAASVMNISSKAVESLFQRAKKNLELLLSKNEGK